MGWQGKFFSDKINTKKCSGFCQGLVKFSLRYQFEWDPAKARENVRKPKVSFQGAATIFRDPNALSIFDQDHSQEEERWLTLGRDSSGILMVVCHTYRQSGSGSSLIRIISARQATKKERQQYEDRRT